jgi:transcription initiation factor IIE alpha subunit
MKSARFYVRRRDETEISLEVTYDRWHRTLRKNETITEKLLFKAFSPNELHHKDLVSTRIVKQLNSSNVALFSDEIATDIQVSKDAVRKALYYLKGRGLTNSKGWFSPVYGKETLFDRGYLWFTKTEQYSNRLKRHDVLTDYRQIIYEMIKINSETERRFTPKVEIFVGSKESRKEKLMKTLCSIYTDIAVNLRSCCSLCAFS